jgi:hypothetical protein
LKFNEARRRKTMKRLAQAGLLIALCMPAAAMAQSNFDGTWRFDLKTAKFPTKPDVYLLQDGTYECKTCIPPVKVKADGQDHPVTGHPYYDTANIKVVNDRTMEETDKKGGKVVSTSKATVSADGKTITFEFTDSSNTNAAPVTGKATETQVAAGPAGSHAVSGSWRMAKLDTISDNAITMTLKVDSDTLHMSTPTGQSYAAKLDGTDSPYKGDPGISSVSVKWIDKTTIEETDKRDGKAIATATMAVAADGKTINLTSHDLLAGTTTHISATKQ